MEFEPRRLALSPAAYELTDSYRHELGTQICACLVTNMNCKCNLIPCVQVLSFLTLEDCAQASCISSTFREASKVIPLERLAR